MKLKIFAIHDRKLEDFAPPMFMQSKGAAIRAFTDEVNRPGENNMLWRHPEDFTIYELGEYDTETGTFTTENPKPVIQAEEVKVREEKDKTRN